MKYIFKDDSNTLPLSGTFENTELAEVEYTISSEDVHLAAAGSFYSPKGLDELIDFLTSVKEHLETK